MKSLAADPAVPGAFYVGTAQGGVYRSVDGGRSWSAPAGGAPFPGYAVTALTPDPSDPGTVWAGLTGIVRGGLLARSDDAARSWSVVKRWDEEAGARVVAVAVRHRRRTIVVGGDRGLEISVDDGLSWRPSVPPLDPGAGISFVAFHPARPDTLYTGSYRHPFRSTDLGRTWKRIAVGMVEDTQVFALDFLGSDPDDIWAATCGWVYRSRDGGGTWVRYRDGLTDRRTQAVRHDPANPQRVLAGTTGGLFESTDGGKSFRRLSQELVVNTLTFDPRDPSVLLVGTETDGVLRSEDGGRTLRESNVGLAEARVSAVAQTASGTVVVARAADGGSGGLWRLDPRTGEAFRLASTPPSTVRALLASGERLLAGTPDGLFVSDGPDAPFSRVLGDGVLGLTAGDGRAFAATETGVFASRDGGRSWERMGSLRRRVDAVLWSRVPGTDRATAAAVVAGRTVWWNGRDWGLEAFPADAPRKLSGGFGRPRVTRYGTPEPFGVDIDAARSSLVFRDGDAGEDLALALPERGLAVAGWAGNPRLPSGLYIATIGRGLFRYVPSGEAPRAAVRPPGELDGKEAGAPARLPVPPDSLRSRLP